MQDKFIITSIERVAMVEKNEYSSDRISFSGKLAKNELIFHFSGYSTVYFGDLILETKPNTVRFLPEGEHGRYDVLRHERGACILVAFKADRPIAPCAFVTSVALNEKIGLLFKKLFSSWVGKNKGYYFESLSLLYKILSELQKDASIPKQHDAKIKPAIDLIHDRFLSDTFYVDQLAALCGIKDSYFTRLFKEKFGMSPKKYIIQLKINHACELLRSEQYSVRQIAELCNFSDLYFFSRQFKSHMGISPTEFAKKYKSSK